MHVAGVNVVIALEVLVNVDMEEVKDGRFGATVLIAWLLEGIAHADMIQSLPFEDEVSGLDIIFLEQTIKDLARRL